jgi:hypothetical protein
MAITLQEGLNMSKLVVFILDIDLVSSCFFRSSSHVSDDTASIRILNKICKKYMSCFNFLSCKINYIKIYDSFYK